jgi:hypothetical protein
MSTVQEELLGRIALAPVQYHRLIIILNSNNQPIEKKLMDMAGKLELRYINLGLELSQMLLDLTERQRALRLPQLVNQVIGSADENPVFLNHIEILFQPDLKQDPLRLLQGVSRSRIIIAAWNGQIHNGYLTYAAPEHPEYHRYPMQDLNILSLSDYSE